jgi:hypothetical protein
MSAVEHGRGHYSRTADDAVRAVQERKHHRLKQLHSTKYYSMEYTFIYHLLVEFDNFM